MAKHQSFNRIRKRVFIVTGLTLGAVILIAALFALYATFQLGPDDVQLITVNEGSGRTAVLGSGVSISSADDGNVVVDGSFEPLIFRKMLTVYSGDETTLAVSSEDASGGEFGDGFFNGAAARIMTIGLDGLELKKTANVVNYGINRVGVFNPVLVPDEVPDGLAILDFARRENQTIAVGEQGLILIQASSQAPAVVDSKITADLTGICSAQDGYYACSRDGYLLHSSDGAQWQQIALLAGAKLNAVASIESGIYAAVGGGGTLVVGQNGSVSQLTPVTDSTLNDIVGGQDVLMAVGNDGVILTSRNGLIWKKNILSSATDWLAADYRDGRFVAVGRDGVIAISDDGAKFTLFKQDSGLDFVDVVMLTSQQLIVLDQEGRFLVSNNAGQTWLSSGIETGMQSRVIDLAGKDKILSADQNGRLGIAQLVAEITLDSSLVDGQYQAGDLIFLEMTSLAVPDNYLGAGDSSVIENPWQFFGYGNSARTLEDAAPQGGKSSMLLTAETGASGQAAILSQKLDLNAFGLDNGSEIYQIELWMKQSGVEDRRVKVWLQGSQTLAGTTFTNVGTSWKKYSYTLALPTGVIKDAESISLNIAIDSGRLWTDQISLQKASDSSTTQAQSLISAMSDLSPQLIRLDYLGIGSMTSRHLAWANSLGNESPYLGADGWTGKASGSLYAALQMTDKIQADPWLTIDAFASQTEILSLIEYLAAPISEPYGRLRMDQGSVVPWSEQFSRIVLEFKDSGNLYVSDQVRAEFVNLMIDTISQSPYYREIKNKLVFVDGCSYDAGVVLSSADYHATDLTGLLAETQQQTVSDALSAYLDLVPRNPEKQTQNWPELMRTSTLTASGVDQPTMAELSAILLSDLGHQTGLSMLSLTGDRPTDWPQVYLSAANASSEVANGIPLEIETESDNILAQGYRSDSQISLVLENLSDQPETCLLLTDLPLSGATVYKYDSRGQMISRQVMRNPASKLTVLSGGVVVIVKTEEP